MGKVVRETLKTYEGDVMFQQTYVFRREGFRRGIQTFRRRKDGSWKLTSNLGEEHPVPRNWELVVGVSC